MPPGLSQLAGFFRGLAAPLHGFRFLRRRPSLWRYALLPTLVNLVISGLVLVGAVVGAWHTADWLAGRFGADWLSRMAYLAALLAVFLVAMVLAFGTWLVMQSVLCGHFYEQLTRRVEQELGLRPEDARDLPFLRGALDSVRDVLLLVGTTVGLQVLHIVPVVGSVAAVGLTLYFDSWILGREYLGYPLALRGFDRDRRRQFLKGRRAPTLGLGASVLLLMAIPIVGALLMTSAVTGAVLLHRRLVEEEPRLDPSQRPA